MKKREHEEWEEEKPRGVEENEDAARQVCRNIKTIQCLFEKKGRKKLSANFMCIDVQFV